MKAGQATEKRMGATILSMRKLNLVSGLKKQSFRSAEPAGRSVKTPTEREAPRKAARGANYVLLSWMSTKHGG